MSTIYLSLLWNISLISLKDRCREYRELLFQAYFGITNLTLEQEQRIQVISVCVNIQYNTILFSTKFLESKLDVFHLAYIRHKLEMEMSFFSPIMEDNNVYQQQQHLEMDQIPVSTVTQTTNSNSRGHHHWNSLIKMKNKLNNVSRGMY